MGGKVSVEVRTRYNKKTYDQINIRVKKGEKSDVEAYSKASGKSLNQWICEAIKEKMERQDAEYTEEVEHIPFTD